MMKAFISYARKDSAFVAQLCRRLENTNVSTWRDVKDINVGDSITERIEQGIMQCDYFFLVLSGSSVSRPWVLREYRAALNIQLSTKGKSIRIIPLKIENCDIPILLRDIKFADFSRSFIDGFESLCESLNIKFDRKKPYFELIQHIETNFGSISNYLQLDQKNPHKHDYHELDVTLSRIWDGIDVSKSEINGCLKSGTELVECRVDGRNKVNKLPKDRIGVIISAPFEIIHDFFGSYDMGEVDPHVSVNGMVSILKILDANKKNILARKLFLIPKSCTKESHTCPDGIWDEEIDLKKILEHVKTA